MRNISGYEKQYVKVDDLAGLFEQKYQVKYRQKIVTGSLQKYRHDSVLEVGCAMDSQGNHMPDMKEYTIVEPGHEFIEKAKADLDGKNVHYAEGFLEDKIEILKEWDYDFVIVGSLLHELEKPELFLEKLKELCNKETVVHVNAPNASSLHRLLAEKSGFIKDVHLLTDRNEQFQQHRVFDLETLSLLIQEVGGEILDRGSYFIKPFTHEQMMQCLDAGIISEDVMDGLDRLIEYLPDLGSEIYVNFRFL